MSFTYPAGILSKTPVTPAGPYAEGAASGVWKLNEIAYWVKQGLWPNANNPTPNDPYFQYVTSLLHGDGTNGGQNNTFLDSSTNAFTITRNGNTTQGSFSPYGSLWSNYFGGSTNLYTGSSIASLSGDFTIECWVNINDITQDSALFGVSNAVASGGFFARIENGNTFNFYANGGDNLFSLSGTIANGTWNHFAVTRASNTVKVWMNGTQLPTTKTISTSFNSDTFYIAAGRINANVQFNALKGYLSNVRLVNGTAVYTSNFTPSTTPLTAVTNTVLLTCQSNRYVDNSSNNYAITINGSSTQVTRFSPFAPTYAGQYSASTIGGSGYFDENGSYLSNIGLTSSFNFLHNTTALYTVECWLYLNAYPASNGTIVNTNDGSSGNIGTFIAVNPSGTVQIYTSNGAGGGVAGAATVYGASTGTIPLYTWTHFAITYDQSQSSNNCKFYINGVAAGTLSKTAKTPSNSNATNKLSIGSISSGSYLINGYVSDVRISNSIVYSSAFTPPTSPLTTSTTPTLLCNMTNGAIYDNAEVADYETVGNAQINTTTKKYGTGSISFDGSTSYLKTDAPDSEFAFGTGNFTVEMWVYFNSVSGSQTLWDTRPQGTSNSTNYMIWQLSSGTLSYYTSGAGTSISGIALSASTWYHIALSRVGNSTKMFVNGTQAGSTYTDTQNYIVGANRPTIGNDGYNNTQFVNGYIDDLRVTKGYARYWENFTPPAAALPNFGGAYQVPTQDPQFNYTALLLPGNGTNGAQNNTFLDSSSNAYTITRNGNTTQGTFSPFSQTGWSTYQVTANSVANNPSIDFSSLGTLSGDFTIEYWMNPSSYGTGSSTYNDYPTTMHLNNGSKGVFAFQFNQYGTSLNNEFTFIGNDTGSDVGFAKYRAPLGQWQHHAIVRSGNTLYAYVNGTRIGSMAWTSSIAISRLGIGAYTAGLRGYYGFNGNISNFRIVNGTAVYTANFTPPTTALTAVSGTTLLTCQSNRFVDNSGNNYTPTLYGSTPPAVQSFSPFAPTATYSASTVGGSAVFDNAGDYLSKTSFSLSGDFSIGFWCYSNVSNFNPIFTIGDSNTSSGLEVVSSSEFGVISGGSNRITGSTFNAYGKWTYVLLTRSGSSVKLFVNGTQSGTTWTSSATFSGILRVGAEYFGSLDDYYSGYISGFFINNTTAISETMPSAPPTTTEGNYLLLNFTNAGITDATAKNDLETVGNAQISTTQSKFGGSSMYFDGSTSYLSAPTSNNFTFGTGDFTIEMWYNPSVSYASGNGYLFDLGTNGTRIQLYNNTVYFLPAAGNSIQSATGIGMTVGTWYHVAAVRYNGVIYLFVNGALVGTNTNTSNLTDTTCLVGIDGYSANPFTGYIQDFRITKGYARYVQPFTPPTQADQLY